MKKKTNAASGKKKKLKIKDLTVGRKAGSVKGGALTESSGTPKVMSKDFRKIIPCL